MEADRLANQVPHGRFQRRRATGTTPAAEHLVLDAVARARGGDQDAMRYLYLRFSGSLYGYICSIVGDEHDAEDLTQQIFAKLPANLERYEPRAVPFAAWLLRIARNAAIDSLRARRAVPCEEVRGSDTEFDDTARERAGDLRDALAQLPGDQRDVILLRFLVGLTPGEVATRMDRSEDAVHALAHRARRALRRELTRLDAAPAVACAA